MDCMGKIARFLTVPLQDMQKQEPAKWSWRACNLAILLGHAGNVPDKIVFGCQSSLRGTEHVPLLFISFLMQNRTLRVAVADGLWIATPRMDAKKSPKLRWR